MVRISVLIVLFHAKSNIPLLSKFYLDLELYVLQSIYRLTFMKTVELMSEYFHCLALHRQALTKRLFCGQSDSI